MCCGSWVPLMVERHHGLNISPVQSELMVAPGPRAPQVMCQRQVETDGLPKDNSETPVPLLPPHADNHHHPNGWQPTALAIIAIHLLPSFNGTSPGIVPLSLVGTPRPAWLGDLLGTCLCHPEAVLHRTRLSDNPVAVTHPLGPGR